MKSIGGALVTITDGEYKDKVGSFGEINNQDKSSVIIEGITFRVPNNYIKFHLSYAEDLFLEEIKSLAI